jgi:hypothetical protein
VKPDALDPNHGLFKPGDLPKGEPADELFRRHRGRLRLAGVPASVLRSLDEQEPKQ